MHLTNNSVQKNVPDYKTQKEQYINSVDDLIDDLLTTGRSHAHESHSSYIFTDGVITQRRILLLLLIRCDRLLFKCMNCLKFEVVTHILLTP